MFPSWINKLRFKNDPFSTKRIFLFTVGSAGSVFLHSLINGHKDIACLPVICDFDRVYRLYKAKPGKSLYDILYEETKLKFVIDKEQTERFGDYSNFSNFDSILFKDQIDKFSKENQINSVKLCSDFVHYSFLKALGEALEQKKLIFEHPHNLFLNSVRKFKLNFEEPFFILTVRHPIMQVRSFFSYFDASKLNYQEVTKRLVALLNSTLEAKKNLDVFHVIRLEDLHSAPQNTFEKLSEKLGVEMNDSFFQSTFGNKPYLARSKNNGNVSGFNENIAKLHFSDLSDQDVAFINYLFYDQYEMFGYKLFSKQQIDEKILYHNFLGVTFNEPNRHELTNERIAVIRPLLSKLRSF